MKKEDQNATGQQPGRGDAPGRKPDRDGDTKRPLEVLEFVLAGGKYAIDIHVVREIVDMVPITPIPRAPRYITGVINLRGEITNIVNLNLQLNLPDLPITKDQKIVVFTADTIKGSNVGIVVDSVSSVTMVPAARLKPPAVTAEGGKRSYVRGIISTGGAESGERQDGLVLLLDILKLFKDIEAKQTPAA